LSELAPTAIDPLQAARFSARALRAVGDGQPERAVDLLQHAVRLDPQQGVLARGGRAARVILCKAWRRSRLRRRN
jgi:hypothetical protein